MLALVNSAAAKNDWTERIAQMGVEIGGRRETARKHK
jgi:hypothetical protein